jgi:predicted aspartyl protease
VRFIGVAQPIPDGLVHVGPLVEVSLAPHPSIASQLAASGKPIQHLPARVMVDTGAEKTVVERRLAEQLGIHPIRYTEMVGVSQTPELAPVYPMTLSIRVHDGNHRATIEFETEVIGMASPVAPRQHVGLLGRDFLRHVKLVYNGPEGRFELIVPRHGRGAIAVRSADAAESKRRIASAGGSATSSQLARRVFGPERGMGAMSRLRLRVHLPVVRARC